MQKLTEITRRGFIMVLSSPSGAGKTTLTHRLLKTDSNLSLSVSVTTRARRPNEVEGLAYHFIDRATFDRMVAARDLLEHATVFGNAYGTPRAPVERVLVEGRDVVSDLDWQGTQQLKQTIRDDLVSVFILPPSIDELERRLTARNQDHPDVVRHRMDKALDEMSHWPEYDYVLVNRDLDESVATLEAIVRAERAKRSRQIGLVEFVREISRR
jgi:guanylate kinase